VWSRPRPNAFLASQTCHGLGGPALVSGHGVGNQIGDGRRIGRQAAPIALVVLPRAPAGSWGFERPILPGSYFPQCLILRLLGVTRHNHGLVGHSSDRSAPMKLRTHTRRSPTVGAIRAEEDEDQFFGLNYQSGRPDKAPSHPTWDGTSQNVIGLPIGINGAAPNGCSPY